MTESLSQPLPSRASLANATVIVLTYRWPFTEKAEFMRDEWAAWTGAKRVVIISVASTHEESRRLAANCIARAVAPVRSAVERLKYLLLGMCHFPFVTELWRVVLRGPRGFVARIRTLGIHLQGAERYRQGIAAALAECSLADHEPLVLYSYWFGAATHASATIRESMLPRQSLVITRAHGSDLYEHANRENYLPYRRTLIHQARATYAISENGRQYAIRHWGGAAPQVHVSRLGTLDHFKGRYPTRTATFTVLSCSYISYLKQVDLIAESISQLRGCRIRWIHVGGGTGEVELRQLCDEFFRDRDDITCELMGNLPHERTVALLQDTNINLLVNASLSEGIPVSMMEAHCCGIPVIGPNVGGVSEIVLPGENGHLLDPPLTCRSIAGAIQAIIDLEPDEYTSLCRQARASWESRFSATTNYQAFVDAVAAELQNV